MVTVLRGGAIVKTTYEKLKKARLSLGLSQDYVAKALGISRTAVTQIELGNRKVSSDELADFCKTYHLSADYLLSTGKIDPGQAVFARGFGELTENDQQEILNLIEFKKTMTRG